MRARTLVHHLLSLLISVSLLLTPIAPVQATVTQAVSLRSGQDTGPVTPTAPAPSPQTPSAQSGQDAPETFQPPSRLQQALREGKWPAQIASGTGSAQPDQHGPQRNDPAEGIPTHAYSPFDERVNREHPCPPDGCNFEAGEVLVKLAPAIQSRSGQGSDGWTSDAPLNRALAEQGIAQLLPLFPTAVTPRAGEVVITADGDVLPKPDLTRWHKAVLRSRSADIFAAVERLAATPGVIAAEPNYQRRLADDGFVSNAGAEPGAPGLATAEQSATTGAAAFSDPLYAQQWHLAAANIPAAWDYLTSQGLSPGGNRGIVVAVIDTGVDYTHPDLATNLWVNPAELTGAPGVDDDGNGFVDDIHGANVVSNQPSGDPQDDHGHGTHVAGIIAAQAGNSIGGVGVAYNTQIMALKAAQYSGVLSASDIAQAIYYAVEKGADVINMSFGGYARSQLEEDALAVAFGQAVLVAAAGNDGKVNLPCPLGRDMYPAAYNWVLGVMARQPNPNAQGDYLAGFSNFDCAAQDSHEYELMAPGVDVWGTLPNEQYAAWDGTSMATPVVSGIAALVRTKWADKNVYSSRFIMGQLATTGGVLQAYTPQQGPPVSYYIPNALAALTTAPQPKLIYLEHWLFDTTAQAAANDNDGIVDAGETIDLAVVIRNHWGKADNVSVKLEAWAEGAVQADPYVTMITQTVAYGAVGSFNSDDNGLIYDDQGAITGVRSPFRFQVKPTTPNNHVIPFRLTVTARNGYAPGDPALTFVSRFYLIVQRGFQVYGEISQDTTWTADRYYIVVANTHIPEGVTLTIEPGTTVAFADGTRLAVRGNLQATGTKNQRITFTSNSLAPNTGSWYGISLFGTANATLSYCDISYARYAIDQYTHAEAPQAGKSRTISYCRIKNVMVAMPIYGGAGSILIDHNKFEVAESGLAYVIIGSGPFTVTNNIFNDVSLYVPNPPPSYEFSAVGIQNTGSGSTSYSISNNTFLNNPIDIGIGDYNISHVLNAPNNYWGTTDKFVISSSIFDYYDTFDRAKVSYEPFLTSPSPQGPPILTNVAISPLPPLSIGTAVFTLTFSADMDTSTQPVVAFGPSAPYSDHTLSGNWVNSRAWVGSFNITFVTGDGMQTIFVANARGEADWMGTPADTSRRFEIITSGTEAMNLQATGGEGYVDLAWTQDDFDLLAGYNVYRAESSGGTYTLVNSGIIPAQQKSLRDTNVQPGQPYSYKFTVVQTSMAESDFSNEATATPLDTIPPVITHTPVTSAPPGLALSLFADVTDNVAVQSVTLHYRKIGMSAYTSAAMIKTTGVRYSATVAANLLVSPGLEYYIAASDGVSTAQAGRPTFPYQVSVVDRPTVTAVSPQRGPISGGTAVTLSGSNFKAGASVRLGEAVCASVVVVSLNQITCATPAHFPALVDVTVTNPDGQSGQLLRSFTYESDVVSIALPISSGGQHDIVQIPLNVANAQGLAAASVTVQFNASVLKAKSATTGSLTSGWSIAPNTGTSGQLRLSLASPGGTVSGSGVLANLEFEVLGSPGVTTTLRLADVSLNSGAIPAQSSDGSFQVDLVYSVSGAVSFWNGGVISGTLLTLTGNRVYAGSSGGDGNFTVRSAPAGNYTLTPSKSDRVNGISAYDASLALQHDAGFATLSGNAFKAADVDKSGGVNSMDAYYILQKAAELLTLPFPGAGLVWDFVPASRAVTGLNADRTGQDFTAILLGDASGNWNASGLLRAGETEQSAVAHLRMTTGAVNPDGTLDAILWADPAGGQLYSLDMQLAFDAEALELLSVEQSAPALALAANTSVAGQIRLALAGAQPLAAPGELLTFHLRARSQNPAAPLLSPLWAEANEGALPVQWESGAAYQQYLPVVGR